MVDRPAHVPESRVYDFDFNADAAYNKDPHQRAAQLAEDAPDIFWTPRNGGHWVVTSHAAVSEAFRRYEVFSSEHFSPEQFKELMETLPESERVPAPIPICVDPPLHTELKAPLLSTFSLGSAKSLQGEMQALAERLVGAVVHRGSCEFMGEIAEKFPVEIFLKMFGLPLEREKEYRELAKKHLSGVSTDIMENMNMMRSIAEVMRATIRDRQHHPQDDIISLLWRTEVEGKPMTFEVMESYCVILFIAGLDTVVNALGFGVRHLAESPQLQAALRGNPALIPKAANELLRRFSFVAPMRLVKQDVEFNGVALKKAELVMLFIPAASVDPAAYACPREFDMDRKGAGSLAFGLGPHYCLGSHLAKVELCTLYEVLLNRLPEFQIDPAHPPTFHAGIIAGPATIHLVWNKIS